MNEGRFLKVLLGIFYFFVLADYYLTYIGVMKGFIEGNPIMAYLFQHIGIIFTLVSMSIVIGMIFLFLCLKFDFMKQRTRNLVISFSLAGVIIRVLIVGIWIGVLN